MLEILKKILRSKKKNVCTVTKTLTFREIVEAREGYDPSWKECPSYYQYLNSDCDELNKHCDKYSTCETCWNQTMEVEVKEERR